MVTPAEAWTTPAAVLGRAPADIQAQVARFIRWGRRQQWTTAAAQPTLTPTFEGSSWSRYEARFATTKIRMWRSSTGGWNTPAPWDEPARWTSLNGAVTWLLPWDNGAADRPAWKGAAGTTDLGLVIDNGDGTYWSILGGRRATWWDRFLISLRPGNPVPPSEWDWVCDAAQLNTPANAHKVEGRGMGNVPKFTGITRASEVAAAVAHGHRGIGHALAAVGFAMETGPKARHLSPSTRVEHSALNNYMTAFHPNAPDDRLTMQGLRLASSLTEADIDRILAALYPSDLTWRATVKVWWMTVSEHGFVLGAETGTGDVVVETTTMAAGYAEAAQWAKLGHTSLARNQSVFAGYPWSSLYAVAPAP